MNDAEKIAGIQRMVAEGASEDEQTKFLTGFTKTELTKAFELVQDPDDWRAKIHSYCTTEEVKVVAAAVEFFTATKPKFEYIGAAGIDILPLAPTAYGQVIRRFALGDHLMVVKAVGYRMGPAGDH